ncbi:N-acetylglucosamine-6-phosphate deacetylase [Dongshaea marina]|uniref:N-acetylglucosamine-6-phosphate deacetylase n=1 Tax=Dongshaea marina TaxID=2047966 RepID=UPI000D3E678D|nr:N-acetylglucosamine-6-phosphate deacetylase [Dongshaea marina]
MGSDSLISASRLLTPDGWIENAGLRVDGKGKITGIARDIRPPREELWLLPGLIDTHLHGAMGCDVMDAAPESLQTISDYLASQGVTGFIGATVTAPRPKVEAALTELKHSYQRGLGGAELLGAYLEGPFLSCAQRGAHPPEYLKDPDPELLAHYLELAGEALKLVALAPERQGGLAAIELLKSRGVRVMLGHSDAGFDLTHQALELGADGLVHCFNGMRGIHHRDPGVVGAGLLHPSAFIEVIADGHHLHPKAIELAYRCCGSERLLLISDSMQATGLEDGDYQLGEYPVVVKQGVVRTHDGGLAGSTLRIKLGVENIQNWLQLSLETAWRSASLTPARLLGIEDELGSLEVGKFASMVAMTPQGEIRQTWVRGMSVYSKQQEVEPCI